MAVVGNFVLAHAGFFASLGLGILNEFIANNKSIQANSIGQLLTNWAKGFLTKKAQPQA